MESKNCKVCKTEFFRKANCSDNNWDIASFCSGRCRSKQSYWNTAISCACGELMCRKCKDKFEVGENHSKWKEGKSLSMKGYVRIRCPNHPMATKSGQYVHEHRLVMEKHLGRYLTSEEVVHHIDFDKTNNDISNLHLFPSHSEHHKHHWMLKKIVEEAMQENNTFNYSEMNS